MPQPLLQMTEQQRIQIGQAMERARRAARKDFHIFGPAVVQDAVGRPIRYAPMHLSWIAHVNYAWSHGLHAGIFAHFGAGKTSAFSVPLAAWLIGRNPQERIKVVCAGDTLASQRVAAIKGIMEKPVYRSIFPGVVPGKKWTEHMVYVERLGDAIDPTLEARGVFSKGVGGRATKIIFDDVCDLQNSSEDGQRNRVKEHVQKIWLSRLEEVAPKGNALWIATPWNADDASYMLRASSQWCWLEQRVNASLTGLEQEVFNAGPDYETATDTNISEMLAQ